MIGLSGLMNHRSGASAQCAQQLYTLAWCPPEVRQVTFVRRAMLLARPRLKDDAAHGEDRDLRVAWQLKGGGVPPATMTSTFLCTRSLQAIETLALFSAKSHSSFRFCPSQYPRFFHRGRKNSRTGCRSGCLVRKEPDRKTLRRPPTARVGVGVIPHKTREDQRPRASSFGHHRASARAAERIVERRARNRM